MRTITGYLRSYLQQLNPGVAIVSVLFLSCLVFLNYRLGLNGRINDLPQWQQYAAWYTIFLSVLSFPYLLHVLVEKKTYAHREFVYFLFALPLVFSWKIAAPFDFEFVTHPLENQYWQRVLYYPYKFTGLVVMVFAFWLIIGKRRQFFEGWNQVTSYRPYFLMLFLMVPLVALAASRDHFLITYPKFLQVDLLREEGNWWRILLFELAYGLDFLTIELFFRGFLLTAFTRWAGRDALLPMALFYCTIHFGKPLAECISSFFGGLLLGIISYHTRSIRGGLIIHLGIAWLMEVGGWVGVNSEQ